MRVVFRVDASPRMGLGHLQRCLSLAQALHARGADIRFITREFGTGSASLVEAAGFTVSCLPAVVDAACFTPPAGSPSHAAWAGVPLERDAEETLAALGRSRPDWLIVDHYAIHAPWQHRLRDAVGSIMVIDDLADRQLDCDLLLDQNLPIAPMRYTARVPPSCTLLSGPSFALLRPEFARLRASLARRTDGVRRVLVFMGGGDLRNVTGRVLNALRNVRTPGLLVDVVLSRGSPHQTSISETCASTTGFTLHLQTPDMAALMARSDLMIGASGGTTWERCSLGLPSVLLGIADNQIALGREAARHRFALYLGEDQSLPQEQLESVLQRALQRPSLLRRMGARAAGMTDGLGASRVASLLAETTHRTAPQGLVG